MREPDGASGCIGYTGVRVRPAKASQAHRILDIERSDVGPLYALAPSFTIIAACTTILASLSKALFLSSHPIRLLPWVFLGSGLLTALCSLGLMALIARTALATRTMALLLLSAVVLGGLRAGFAVDPKLVGIVVLLAAPAVSSLVIVQVWSIPTATLATRQAKRLLPKLAALTTLGAALGGAMVQLLLRWMPAEDLLLLTALMLVFPAIGVRRTIRRLQDVVDATAGPTARRLRASPSATHEDEQPTLRELLAKPLLVELAALVFLLQGASVLLDYQFSAELQPRYGKDELASFLGTFYWSSNLLVLGIALVATSRIVRTVGIGIALAASAIVIGLGSLAYIAGKLTASPWGFWIIAAAAFGERLAQYGFSKPATQMAYMPLAGAGGERAKTFIEGVVYRLATAAVSALLLLSAPSLVEQHRLSFPMAVACLFVVVLGVRLGPHYRRAVLDALRARRLDSATARYLRDGLGRGAHQLVAKQLESDDEDKLIHALRVARDLALEVPHLERLLVHADQAVARASLSHMQATGYAPDRHTLSMMLHPKRPIALLRETLKVLSTRAAQDASLVELVRPLTTHPDAGVAAAACVLRLRARGAGAEEKLDRAVATNRTFVGISTAVGRLTGVTRAGRFARDLKGVLSEPDEQKQRESIAQMGELALPAFFPLLSDCFDHDRLRAPALRAMAGYSKRVAPLVKVELARADRSVLTRAVLITALERHAPEQAYEIIVEHAADPHNGIRDHAVNALWRLSRVAATEKLSNASHPELYELVTDEIAAIECYGQMADCIGDGHERARFVRDEVAKRAAQAEMRTFRLLGLLSQPDAMHRAYLHYKSRDARSRSNAIELLDQHLRDSQLRRFIAFAEGAGTADSSARQVGADGTLPSQLDTYDPWLVRCHDWQARAGDGRLDPRDELDMLVLMSRGEIFSSVSGQLLAEVRGRCRLSEHEAGEWIIKRGEDDDDLFVVVTGVASAQRPGRGAAQRPLAVFEPGAIFGELAALDGGSRSAHIVADTAVRLLRMPRAAVHDLCELEPRLWRQLIRLLNQRLRLVMA